MELTASGDRASDPPSLGWAQILGTAIAILTLTVPTLSIAHYSYSSENRTPSLSPPYSSEPLIPR